MRRLVVAPRALICGLSWLVLGCGPKGSGATERATESPSTGVLIGAERSAAASTVASASTVAYSIRRRLSDFADDDPAVSGETIDTWTCREDGTCTSEGVTDVAISSTVRVRINWRNDYDARGYPIRMHSKYVAGGWPDQIETFEFADGSVKYTKEDGSGRTFAEYVLPPRFRPCSVACREQVTRAGATTQSCHAVYPDGVRGRDSTVRPVDHPKLGAVWEWTTFLPETGIEDVRIVDANCQQLEARLGNLRSLLLSEERTGSPPVPAYGGG